MRRLRHVLFAIVTMIVLAIVGGFWWLCGTLPQTDGELIVEEINTTLIILRDGDGVANIRAKSERDATFGLGFVHAQERFWQMELARRVGSGRLAEMLGARALPADRYFRTLGLAHVAEHNLAALSAETRNLLTAYAAGVNAYLTSHDGPLAIELALLRHTPEPWRPSDSIIAIQMMATQLAGNAAEEAMRAKLLKRLSPEQVATLWTNDAAAPRPWLAGLDDGVLERTLAALPPPPPADVGSNNWVVAGWRSTNGKPILANDPHLRLTAPTTWYLAHLSAPGFNVIGATIPGIPVVVVGRNRDTAWGVTNTGTDVQDLFVVDEDDVIGVREEAIGFGDDSGTIIVRETAHGPIISDVRAEHADIIAPGQAIALRWTMLDGDDPTIQAGFALARASSVDDVRRALRDFHGPMQSFVMADSAGAIAFLAAGRVPVRAAGDGWLPNNGEGAWGPDIPFDELPAARNPAAGVLFSANQRIVASDYPHFLTYDWAVPYRARRIADVLGDGETFASDDFRRLQNDTLSLMARDFLPRLLAGSLSVRGEAIRPDLAAWDRTMAPDRPEPLIFHAWYRALVARIFADELGEEFSRLNSRRPLAVERVLDEEPEWCDDVTTDEAETCAGQIARALDDGLDWIAAEYGSDVAAWRWDAAHIAISRHALFSKIPVLKHLFEITRPHGGGPYTVMQANTRIDNADAPFAEVHAAALRSIFDLSGPDTTRAIVHTGQSGHRLSRHYDDLADRWAAGELLSLPMTAQAVDAAAVHHLILRPR